jgi:predicted permease
MGVREIAGRAVRRIAYWLHRRRHEAELAEEMAFHREMVGRRAFGNETLAREDAGAVWGVEPVDRLWRDVRYAARGLRREPGFALGATLTLALGVTTVTTVFSVADSELWKPWPLPSVDRLVIVSRHGPGVNYSYDYVSGLDLIAWQTQARAFEAMGAVGRAGRGVLSATTTESVRVMPVTSGYFSTLGWPIVAGRTAMPGDEAGGRTAMISERAWTRLFNRDPAAVGRTVTLDGRAITIVGVVATIDGLGAGEDFYPVMDPGASDFRSPRAAVIANVVARIRPEVSRVAAQAEMRGIAAEIARAYPEGRAGHTIDITTLDDYYAATYNAPKLFLFLGASALVLLLSCANVATLILTRALTRRREFGIRSALGGGPIALARQLMIEGAALALPAGLLGLLLTAWSLSFLSIRLPADYLFHGDNIHIDARVGAFALLVTSATAIVFGLVPALFARRVDLTVTLGDGGRTAGRGRSHSRVRTTLLAAQIAMTLVLLAGAGLFLRSYALLTRVPLGFEPEQRFATHVSVSGPRYAADAQVRAYGSAALERVEAVPGITAAVIATSGPLESGPAVNFVVPARPRPGPGDEPRAIVRSVGPAYFAALGIPIVRGRAFTAADADGAPRVTIVNETLARRIFPGEDPIGRVIELLPRTRAGWANRPGPVTIVGVSANVKEIDVHEAEANSLSLPFAQAPSSDIALFVRAVGDRSAIVPAIRDAIGGVDRTIPVRRIFSFGDLVADSLRGARFNAMLITWFAAIATLIATVGVYAAMSRGIRERTREFGVRMALGASRAAILRSALRQAGWVVGAGGTAGVFVIAVLGRVLGTALYLVPGEHTGILYGVSMTDPLVIALAVGALIAVAVAASVFPARQATRVDPLIALRSE